VLDPGRLPWHEIRKVDHYQLSVSALTQPMRLSEKQNLYERRDEVDS
jgi:hypothetical protein